MILVGMIVTDEDALTCDFAETYHIHDYKRLPVDYAATLASGLRDNSRIKLKLSGARVSTEIQLQAAAVDALNFLVWAKTKNAKHGTNKPKSIYEALTSEPKQDEYIGFDSAAEFEKARAAILSRG